MNIRKAQFLNTWYPENEHTLKKTIKEYLTNISNNKINAKGIIAPHAGYIYSGETAGTVYSKINIPDNIIILCPNHTGLGSNISIMNEGVWESPLGDIPINSDFANNLLKSSNLFEADAIAHAREHSIEIQLPFLKYLNDKIKITPISISDITLETCKEISQALYEALKNESEYLIIASTDMSHGETIEKTIQKDNLAIEKIKQLDGPALYRTVLENSISMCGFIPTTIMLLTCKNLGARNIEITKHTNSYEISKNKDYIVGYLGSIIY